MCYRRARIMALLFLTCLWCDHHLIAQKNHPMSNIHFSQLTTAEGLTDNYVTTMAVDRSGYLWVGTGEGLNRFDGTSVEKYFHLDYPALYTDNIYQIVCDAQNQLWIMSGDGYLNLMDEQRKFHRIGLYRDNKYLPTRVILTTKSHGIILFMDNEHLVPKPGIDWKQRDSLTLDDFEPLHIMGGDSLRRKRITYCYQLSDDEWIFSTTDGNIRTINYKDQKLTRSFHYPQHTSYSDWDDHSVIVYDHSTFSMGVLDLNTGQKSDPFSKYKDQFGKSIRAQINYTDWISHDQLVISTQWDGVYLLDTSSHTLINYRHDPADPTTLVNDAPRGFTFDSTGWVFISVTPNGISYFNRNAVIGQQLLFQDGKGKTYDGFIRHISTLDNDVYFISSSINLIKWKRSTNTSTFISFPLDKSIEHPEHDQVIYSAVDRFQHLWVATYWFGIYVLDEQQRIIYKFPRGDVKRKLPVAGVVNHINNGPDDHMWVATSKGVMRIDPSTFQIENLDTGNLANLGQSFCMRVEFFDADDAWFCTNKNGVWQYDLTSGNVKIYNDASGLQANTSYCVNKDKLGNMYFGTTKGLDILFTNGTFKHIDEKNGLLNKRVEALLLDKQNRMWIGNDVGLACFNIADTTVRIFDERYGLSIQGFRTNAYHQNNDDELLWGTERGLQYFYPDELYNQTISLRSVIDRVESRDIDNYLSTSATYTLSPRNNYITFYFSTVEFGTYLYTFYQYQLEGLDEEWLTAGEQKSVRYNNLPAGDYVFKVRASNDKKTWFDAENEIRIHLQAELVDRPWFRWSIFMLFCVAGGYMISRITKKQKERTEALETESVINYLASEINKHKRVEDMLWDVAKNCISRLNLEECVIYLVDPKRQVLMQRAAYGPKTRKDQTIVQPIDIPIGHGITGSVVLTKKPIIVNNTEKDSRYIVDDDRRLSEMAVPIIVDDEVIGVIDTENSKRNFFTPKHLSLMTTISILTANQIQRIQAEEEKQKAEIEILQNKQKATESRLKSLRLQMNPHFLFNALNSIQQMILANEEMVATRYLSRFSKLLRSILIHSDKELISLKEELDILKLYVELESVRFKEAFTYDIYCDEDIDVDEIKIPTLLVQPFVENAIWHGLMHKEGMRHLKISFIEQGDLIQCIVEDNGIGRQKAKEMKISTGQDKKHTSKGIEVSMERLKAMQKNGGPPGSLHIHDLIDAQGQPIGTRIEINLPIQN